MALAIDHRPPVLENIAGNKALKVELGSMLKRDMKDIPHSFLLSGLSGGGKTTVAGCIANALKCSDIELYEVNSAHFRGIDTARELGNTIRYPPTRGPVRVWVFNEVHKWTNDAQNAMLDILEKAPKHCFFVLTTTEPQKLIIPLKKRCVEFTVQPLTGDEMFDLLVSVCDKEKADVPDDMLEKIISVAQGSSRNALQLLERVIDLSVAEMREAAMVLDDEETITKDLINALLKKRPWKEVAGILKRLTAEPENIRYAVLGYCNAILTSGQDNKQAALIMACFAKNTYDTGRNGITMAAYDVLCG